ncbi:MAG: DUF928 domain-containing protein [Rhodopila sp.]
MTIFCGAGSFAAPQPPDQSQTPPPKDTKANEAPRKGEITYVPPDLGAPAVRVSGGTRGTADAGLSLDVLAPNQTGLTTQEQPTLYWYISRSVRADIRLSIVADTSNNTVLDVKVPGGATAGIHAFSLKGTRVHLALNTDYQWSVTAVQSRDPSGDIVATGMIRRVHGSTLDRELRATSEAAATYARSGLWYDALQALSEAIRARPNDLSLQYQRSALLHQVGLAVPTTQDRSALP